MTIALDFDGVLHTYENGWQDGSIYGQLIAGALTGVRELQRSEPCFVLTAREDLTAVADWLTARGLPATDHDCCAVCEGTGADLVSLAASLIQYRAITVCSGCGGSGRVRFWDDRNLLLVTNRKLPATCYIDDRGYRFTTWTETLSDRRQRSGE